MTLPLASQRTFDLLAMWRSSIDLYSNNPGAPFAEIDAFGAFVGGCPTNVAVGTRRLGHRVALLTAVGTDPVGDFVLRFLQDEGIDLACTPRKPEHRTSAVVLGIEPPDRFPLVFYRDGCADIELSIDDVAKAPIADARVLLITGTGLSKEPSRSATMWAAEQARAAGTAVVLDVDFRADQWHDPRAFGVVCRSILPQVDLVIGTEEELKALAGTADVVIHDAQVSSPQVGGDLDAALATALAPGPVAVALKRGDRGAVVYTASGEVIESSPFPVDVVNVLGAGDAFASGLLHGLLQGDSWEQSLRWGNATGAIVVTRQGCANFMPTAAEVADFLQKVEG